MIAPELIEQIKESADLVTLIGEHVELKRTGTDWRGPCPFHGGTHRNFSVVPKKQMYHCFVCHESGDIFTFWMKKFGLDYPSAVKEIAGRLGIEVPEQRAAGPDPNEPLYSALGVAADWMARQLRDADDAKAARAYLAGRGLDDAVRDAWQLGWAPRGDGLREALTALGLDAATLARAGLTVTREDGAVASRFRGRLMFPIADVRGRVVGFGGRLLGDGEPKYLNSPESEVFHKGTLLFGLDRARGAIRTEGVAVLVEGYFDCIRLQAAGIGAAVAPLGTSLTAEQAKVLRRYTRAVVLAYDADAPGLKATFRAGDELLRQGVSVSVLTMPAGEDPDTVVATGGAAAFRALLGQAVDVFERKIQLLERRDWFASLQGRRRALDRLLPTIRAAADPITRGLYIGRAAEKSGMQAEVLEHEVGRGGRAAPGSGPAAAPGRRPPDAPVPEVPQERTLVQVMLRDPRFVARAAREVPADAWRHPVYARIAALLREGATAPPDDLLDLWERLAQPVEAPFDAEAEYAAAVEWIRDRPRHEALLRIDREMPLASPEQKEQLFAEKRALLDGLAPRFRRKAFKAEREPKV